jgi:hypothetical protein
VEKAFDFLSANVGAPEQNFRFEVSCANGARGIYLREAHHMSQPKTVNVCIEPIFKDNFQNTIEGEVCFW